MKKKIETIQNLLQILTETDALTMFRGQTRNWPLLPSIARLQKVVDGYGDWRNFHDKIINNFLRLGYPYLLEQHSNGTDSWIMGQHYNLPTLLLDTSTNPLKALFFSVNIPSDDKYDGVFYIIEYNSWREDLDEKHINFWDNDLVPFLPKQLNSRLTAQEGAFISYPLPENSEPLVPMDKIKVEDPKFLKVTIPASAKPRLRWELSSLGIQYRLLFPDLDGVARGISLSLLEEIVG